MKKLFAFFHILVILALICVNVSIYISPSDFGYAAFFGLGYPVFLLTSIVFLVFGVILKSHVSWFNALVIIVSLVHLNPFFSFGSPSEEKSELTITTFNARLFDKYEWLHKAPETKVKIYQYLNQMDSDIYCFQEFYNESNPGDFNTLNELKTLLNSRDEYHFYSHNLNNNRDFGLQIFSKYPIISAGKITFKNDSNNGVIYADVARKSDTLRIYTMHLGSIRFQNEDYKLFSDETEFKDKSQGTGRIVKLLKDAYKKRAEQVLEFKKHINQSPYPVIVCGDLNDTPVSYSYHILSDNLEDAFLNSGFGIGTTYEGKVPANRIDYILHSSNFESTNFKIQENVLSDHRAITAYFK